jgi:hypothetical protein
VRGVGLDVGIGVLVGDRDVHACTFGVGLREGGSRSWRVAAKLERCKELARIAAK